jgi:GntR family transcriptional repressor for pyruvate dehydrogenase complex
MKSLNTPVKQGSVVTHVIDRIKEALMNRELKPGDFLPSETELAKNLGVGKTSIREAVKMLQALGIVEVRRGQGTIVRPLSGENFINSMIFFLSLEDGHTQDIIDLRRMFEPAYTLMAMYNATEEDCENVKETHRHLEKAINEGTQTVTDDLAFHRAILQCTHNPFVIWIGEAILQLFKKAMSRAMQMQPQSTLEYHSAILKAFCEQDKPKLLEALYKSFEQWKTPVEEGEKNT